MMYHESCGKGKGQALAQEATSSGHEVVNGDLMIQVHWPVHSLLGVYNLVYNANITMTFPNSLLTFTLLGTG